MILSDIKKILNSLTVVVALLFSMLAVAAEEGSAIAQKTLPHAGSEQLIKMVLGLLFVLAMIFLVAFLFKKYIGSSFIANASLKTIAGVSVGQKERVVLVQVGDRQILVGVSPGQVNMLYTIEKGSEVCVKDESKKFSFSEKLKQSMMQQERK